MPSQAAVVVNEMVQNISSAIMKNVESAIRKEVSVHLSALGLSPMTTLQPSLAGIRTTGASITTEEQTIHTVAPGLLLFQVPEFALYNCDYLDSGRES